MSKSEKQPDAGGYLVLARKYRSAAFDEVVGQQHVAQTLANAIKAGRIAHAYLFTGTRGVGKTTMARILAKALNCLSTDGPTAEPCNKCDACLAIARGDDIDVVEMDGASNRGIEEVRQLRSNTVFRPARCRFKIYYIDEVHQLTKDAFNALLKTLEEPPPHVKFIFATTEAEKLPATILSRCQRFDFRSIPAKQIAEHLARLCESEKVQADEGAIFRIARAAAGSMRDGLSLLDQVIAAGAGKVAEQDVLELLGTADDERSLSVARAIADGDPAAALSAFAGLIEAGSSIGSALGGLCETMRNMMLARVGGQAADLIELGEVQKKAVIELAGRFSLPALTQAVAMLSNVAYKVRTSSIARPLAEAVVVRLAAADKFVDPVSLIERIETMESGAPAQGGSARPATGAFAPPAARQGQAFQPRQTPAPPQAQGARQAGQVQSAQTAQPPQARQPQPPAKQLSTAEKQQIQADPAVKNALGLFGGQVIDVRAEEDNPKDDQAD
ncbi:MAG: DNA polymerase III subunit gamma/tau [Planctomycetes bacterium]|nr:DNA polymerase III subunit gamma/tau [Planctomycetota bacterium]